VSPYGKRRRSGWDFFAGRLVSIQDIEYLLCALICDRDHCLSHRQIRNALRRTAIELR
jgi:hypothetical protein